jgi:Ser/Thr protein kinase RdoA (MazF antagonist)
VRWPDDHPAVTDPALAPWAGEGDRLCPKAEVIRVLRHLPGRRVTTLVGTGAGELAVLKLFATSRARGGHRRLIVFAESRAGFLVPRPLGHRKGHLALVEFIAGTPLDQLSDEELVGAAALAGRALRHLHDSGAELGRTWGVADEIAQLRRTAGPATRAAVDLAIAQWTPPAQGRNVPSHRDCHPAQVVWTGGRVRFIDLDDSAMAPPGLDVGNFLAHLQMKALLEPRKKDATAAAMDSFASGYGSAPPALGPWTRLALARLAALAETRHKSLQRAEVLCGALEQVAPSGAEHRRPA